MEAQQSADREGPPGRTTRRPRDLSWGRGRRLVLIDVENVVGGPCTTEACARWAKRRLEDELGPFGDAWCDQVWVGVDVGGLHNVAWQWPAGRPLEGDGENGADLALLEGLTDDGPPRFERGLGAGWRGTARTAPTWRSSRSSPTTSTAASSGC